MYNLAALYGPEQVAGIEYHPTSDPFGTPETQSRINWYSPTGTPTMYFDGYQNIAGGGVPMEPYYQPVINAHLLDDASLTMVNDGYIGATSGQVTVHINVEWVEYSSVKLRFALIEHNLYYGVSIYNYICRDLLPEETLTITSPGQTFDITRTFAVQANWNSNNMDVVTFVQYDANKFVLQSRMGFGTGPPDLTVLLTPYGSPIYIPATGGTFEYNIAVTNNEPDPQTFDFWIDVMLPSGSIVGPILGPVSVTMPGSTTINRDRNQTVPASAPTGAYVYTGYVGEYPDAVWDSSYFMFAKMATGEGEIWIGDWFNSVEPLMGKLEAEPTVLALAQNYPNPFNPETTICFDLPEASSVTLAVYDLAGREVARLADGFRSAGRHQVTWDASAFSAGVYIYRLTTSHFTTSGKMILMK